MELSIKLDDVWTDGEKLSTAVMGALVETVVAQLKRDELMPEARKSVAEGLKGAVQETILGALAEVLDATFEVPMNSWGEGTRTTSIRAELKRELAEAVKEMRGGSRGVYAEMVKTTVRDLLREEIQEVVGEVKATVKERFEEGVRSALPKM